MRLHSNDQPFKLDSSTTPRTEMRILNDYYTGLHSIKFDLFVVSGTDGVSVMQIFGGDRSYNLNPQSSAATSLQLRVYNGQLMYYNNETLAYSILDRWLPVNVTHNANSGDIQIWVDGQLALETKDRGTDKHYFK
ncbi:Citrate-binding protein, partial [Tetrabaena socialis]